MKTVPSNFVAPQLLTAAFTIAALAVFTCVSQAQEPAAAPVAEAPKVEMITPAQWLKRQPKPIFKPGHTLPRLTRYASWFGSGTSVELTENWHYALQIPNYLNESEGFAKRTLSDPEYEGFKLVALTLSNPKKYPLAVVLSRDEPVNPAPDTFLRDAEGKLIDGQQIYSPLTPQSTLDQMAELRARPLRALRKKVPINIVLNGGEYGLGVWGFLKDSLWKDPKVVAAQAKSGLDWVSFISRAKKREMDTIAEAVRKAVPDRNLYVYYATGSPDRNRYWGWRDWGGDPEDGLEASDLPATEYYYKHFNSGYLSALYPYGDNDMLSRVLNSTGLQITHGKKYSYDWLSGGWGYEADPNAPVADPVAAPADVPVVADTPKAPSTPQYQEGNAAALVDPTAGGVSPTNLYTGFLKCLFTSGTLGGNAGYYEVPGGGYDGTFPADKPKNYLPQMTSLSQVQALFSHLETDVRNSDLLPGPNKHAKSTDQPAYEFPTNDANTRVLARKHKTLNKWLVTAWAADGVERPVKVTIPVLGKVTLLARAAGSVYTATLVNKKPQLMLTDSDAMLPTVKGFKPQAVTEAQILAAAPKASTAPVMNNLQVWFDAAKGIEKDEKDEVASWKPGGTLANWQVYAKPDAKKPLWVADAANGLPAVRFKGEKNGLFSQKLEPEPAFAGDVKTIFAVYASQVPFGYGGDGCRILSTSTVGEGAPVIFQLGNPPNPEKQTWQVKMDVTYVTATPDYLALASTVSKEWGGEGPQMNDRNFTGDLAEILIYRGTLTPLQQFQVQSYLKAKYKLGT